MHGSFSENSAHDFDLKLMPWKQANEMLFPWSSIVPPSTVPDMGNGKLSVDRCRPPTWPKTRCQWRWCLASCTAELAQVCEFAVRNTKRNIQWNNWSSTENTRYETAALSLAFALPLRWLLMATLIDTEYESHLLYTTEIVINTYILITTLIPSLSWPEYLHFKTNHIQVAIEFRISGNNWDRVLRSIIVFHYTQESKSEEVKRIQRNKDYGNSNSIFNLEMLGGQTLMGNFCGRVEPYNMDRTYRRQKRS